MTKLPSNPSATTARTGVICASNPRNSGMYCVDKAARRYFRSIGQPFDLIITQGRPGIGDLRYRMIRDASALMDYDTLVYWGDFLNNPMWGINEYSRTRWTAGHEAALEEWMSLYLRARHRHPHLRVVVAGGCALGASSHLQDPNLSALYREFLDSAEAVILRDPDSVEIAREHGSSNAPIKLGFDCASLLQPFEPAQWRGSYFAYSFHRSLDQDEAQAMVATVERQTGLRGVRIDWLHNRWPRRLFHLRLHSQLALMRHARFCLTDIYHFSVCAMTQGTAALCFSKGEQEVNSTLNERKKALLFDMIGLRKLHQTWTAESWRDGLDASLSNLRRLEQQPEGWSSGFQRAQQSLRSQLDQLFAPARTPRPVTK